MTYAEIAAALGLPSAKAGEAKARRAKWERQVGNDGFARVAVPLSVLEEPNPQRRARPATASRASEGPPQALQINLLLAELKAAQERAIEELKASHDRLAGELRDRAVWAEGVAATLQGSLAHEQAQVVAEREARQAAEARLEAARSEMADWMAGGPLARAWRALLYRRR
jgi:hypothetical protein